MKKRGTSRLSILLAICLIVTAIPMSSAADNTRATTDTSLAGTYILYNSYAQTYATPASTTLTQGTAVQHGSYTGQSTQQWVITPVSGTTDRYYIKMGSLCIGTASNGNTAYMQIPYGTSATYQQWYLEPTEIVDGRFGRYKIRSANPNYSDKVLGVAGLTAGTQLELRTYTDNSYYQDEWYLCPIDECVIDFNLYYDLGYLIKVFPNDTTSSTTRILTYVKKLQEIYIRDFGIWIDYAMPSYVSILANQCTVGVDELCSHGTCQNSKQYYNPATGFGYFAEIQNYHHTNISNIAAHLPQPAVSSGELSMLFLGHYNCSESCDHTTTATIGYTKYGLCYDRAGVSVITNWGTMLNEQRTAIHEFDHFFFAEDHYDQGGALSTEEMNEKYQTDAYDENCLHGENRNGAFVLNTLAICDGCRATIIENRNRFN